jgi:iron(III) transport system ATP-binding protein
MENIVFIGEAYEGDIKINDTLLTTTIEPTEDIQAGSEIFISFAPQYCFIIEA